MTNTTTLIVAAGMSIALLIGLPTGNVAAGNPPAVACVPAAVPAEYLIYHALAAARVLPLHASCPSNKVIRT